jgi:hypothetical protein
VTRIRCKRTHLIPAISHTNISRAHASPELRKESNFIGPSKISPSIISNQRPYLRCCYYYRHQTPEKVKGGGIPSSTKRARRETGEGGATHLQTREQLRRSTQSSCENTRAITCAGARSAAAESPPSSSRSGGAMADPPAPVLGAD